MKVDMVGGPDDGHTYELHGFHWELWIPVPALLEARIWDGETPLPPIGPSAYRFDIHETPLGYRVYWADREEF